MMPARDLATGPAVEPGIAVEVAPGLRRLTAPNPGLMTGPGTNTYLVGSGTAVAVVDPGPEDGGHLDAVVRAAHDAGAAVRWVLVTHTHPDHAPGAGRLAGLTGAEIIGFGPRDGFVPDRSVADGWRLESGDVTVRAVHTPGHASNHLCWLVQPGAILLSGDHIMQGSTVVIRPPDGDMTEYLSSLRRLRSLTPPPAAIGPGHGRMIGDPTASIEGIIAHRLAREAEVLAALDRLGPATVDQLLPTVYADVDEEHRRVGRYSLWAHLRKLVDEGTAVRLDEPGPSAVDEVGDEEPVRDGTLAADAAPAGNSAPAGGAEGPGVDDHPQLRARWVLNRP